MTKTIPPNGAIARLVAAPHHHMEGAATIPFPRAAMAPLDGDTGADVCVVGASFVGLRTAYDLLRMGKTVVVIDAGDSLPEHDERREDAHWSRLNDLLTGAGMEDQPRLDHRAPATSSEMAHAIVALGGRIHGATRALDIGAEHHMQVVKTAQGAIVARVVVMATDQRKRGIGARIGRAARDDELKPGDTLALRVMATSAAPAGGRSAAPLGAALAALRRAA